jgi:hypothetical protein
MRSESDCKCLSLGDWKFTCFLFPPFSEGGGCSGGDMDVWLRGRTPPPPHCRSHSLGHTSPPRPSPNTPTLTLPPPSLSVTLPSCGAGAWTLLPLTPNPPPHALTVSWEARGWEMRTVGGKGGVRGQAPPFLIGSLYRNTEEGTSNLQ